MANSHFPFSVLKEMISDTLHSNSIVFYAKCLRLYHQATFDMRHKILITLLELSAVTDTCLGNVSDFDETFILDCYKSKKLDPVVGGKPHKHGWKALKSGISSKCLCICKMIQRKGTEKYLWRTHCRWNACALWWIKKLPCVYRNRRLYGEGLHEPGSRWRPLFNLNMVNGFHNFIKKRY